MIDKFVKWQKKKYSQAEKTFHALSLSSIFIFVFIPGIPLLFYKDLDKNLALSQILNSPLNFYLGFPTAFLGFFLFTWTVWLLLRVGKGTQVPVVPTQKLVVIGLYKLTRNPMVLAVVTWIIGLGFLLNSFSFIIIGLITPLLYLTYIKLVEEKELEARFGKNYQEYKKQVPFLIPSIREWLQSVL